jgi:TolA-binding protein
MYRLRIFIVCVTLSSLSGGTPAALAGPAEDQYAVGSAHYTRGRWQLAIDEFTTFLSDFPDHRRVATVQFFLGEALVQLGRYDEAHEKFMAFLQKEQRHAYTRQAKFRVGETAFLLKKPDVAQPLLEQFHELYPRDPLNAYVLPYLGEVALANQDGEGAEKRFSAAARLYPTGPFTGEARFGLARAHALLDQPTEAIRIYHLLVDGDHLELADIALLNIGLLYYQDAQHDEAIAAFDALATKFPQSRSLTKARYWKGAALVAQRRWDDAIESLESIASYASDHPLADATQFLLAESLRNTNRVSEAMQRYEHLAETAPDSRWADDALQIVVELAFESDDVDKARQTAVTFLERFPDSPIRYRVQQTLGRCLLQDREYETAINELRNLADRLLSDGEGTSESAVEHPLLETTLYYLAMAHLGAADEPSALALLDELVATGATGELATRVSVARASILVAEKQYAAAIDPLQQYLHANPDGAERGNCLAKLIVCLTETNNLLTAAEHYESYASEFGEHPLLLPTTEFLAKAADSAKNQRLAEELYTRLAHSDVERRYRVQGLAGLGRLYMQRGERERTAKSLGDLLLLAPDDALAPEAALARAYAVEPHDAVDSFRLVFERYPSSDEAAIALFEAARLEHQSRHDTVAYELLRRLTTHYTAFEQLDTALYLMAWVSIDLNRSDEAYGIFQRLADEHHGSPYWGDAVYRLAEQAHSAGDWQQVDQRLKVLLERGCAIEIRGHAFYLKAQAAVKQGQWERVVAPLEQLLSQLPHSPLTPAARYWIAEAHYRQQRYADAEPLLIRLLDETAGQQGEWVAMIPLRLAQIEALRDQWNAALTRCQTLLDDFPNFPQRFEVDYLIGRCLTAQARFSEAREAYGLVVRSDSGGNTETAAKSQWMIGETYFHQKSYELAIRAYHRVESLYAYPKWSAAALLQAGKCHELRGDWKQAVRLYAQVLQEYPNSEFATEASQRLKTARRSPTMPFYR